jgi:hypothetical protein
MEPGMLAIPPEPIHNKANLAMSNIIAIPLNELTRSARSVRKSGGEPIDDLAASILVHGLIVSVKPSHRFSSS